MSEIVRGIHLSVSHVSVIILHNADLICYYVTTAFLVWYAYLQIELLVLN